MAAGDERRVVVAPADGYGEFASELLETLPRSALPADMELEERMGLRMCTQDGRVVVVYVRSADDQQVVVDPNHSLAGKALHFDVRIAGLRQASEAELGGGCEGEDEENVQASRRIDRHAPPKGRAATLGRCFAFR